MTRATERPTISDEIIARSYARRSSDPRTAAVEVAAGGEAARGGLGQVDGRAVRVVPHVVGDHEADGAAVGDDDAVEADAAAQLLLQQLVGAERRAVDRVVRAHDAAHRRLLDELLEGRQVWSQRGRGDIAREVRTQIWRASV